MSESTSLRLVTFRVGRDLYAVDVACVQRVLRYVVPRQVPRLPPWLEGLTEFDGEVVPVADLRERLGASALDLTPRARLLVVSVDGSSCAVVVDQVLDVRPCTEDDIEPAPRMVRGLSGEFVKGVITRDGELVLIVDLAGLLSAAEKRELDGVHA
ncbi:MAG: chemotaxis protein CheW [Gemmatimonadota bacterium]